jgi:hypothetical protein
MTQAIKFVSTMALFYALVSAPAIGQKNLKGAVCTLSDSQTQKSIEAFAKIAAFVTSEPRCVNCHGGVNPFVDKPGEKDPEDPKAPASTVEHGGGKQAHRTGAEESGCDTCHDNMAPTRGGKESFWTTAPSFLSFLNKDAPTLCKQVKQMTGNAKAFMEHLKDDRGFNNFAGTAFLGNRGLNSGMYSKEVPPKPPSISQAAFMKMGQDWIDAMGGEFKGDEGCGCVPAHYAIRLTYTSEYGSGGAGWKVSSKADIPVTFVDDQSFSGQAPVNSQFELSGGACRIQGAAGVAIKASGNAIETAEKQAMHLQFNSVSASTGNMTVTCPGVSRRFGFSKQNMEMGQLPPFDLKGMVGEATDRRVNPYSNLHLEIVKREP